MYEQINQRAAQQAVQAKVEAACRIEQGFGMSAQLRDKPLMEVEYDALSLSISELEASVSELLARIAPVCQPSGLNDAKEAISGSSTAPEAMPSEMRSKLLGLRLHVQAISRQIAPIKFRIEI